MGIIWLVGVGSILTKSPRLPDPPGSKSKEKGKGLCKGDKFTRSTTSAPYHHLPK